MKKLNKLFEKKKSVPLDKFLNFALYDKEFGYYTRNHIFGKKGDFITAPLISNLFGEMISIWCISFWEHLKKPKKILITELGPGDGSLCETLLKTFKNFSEFYNAVEFNLIEVSKNLKLKQMKRIRNNKVKWINNIKDIKTGPIIFLCNEFFDALPIKQIHVKKKRFYEKFVSFSKKKKLNFVLKNANNKLVNKVINLKLHSSQGVIEYPLNSIKYIKDISKKINKYNGGLLIIDYGNKESNNQNTLQSVRKHNFSNILSNVGKNDITSLVDFKLLSFILKKENLKVNKLVNQNEFLQKLGIKERANIIANKITFKSKAKLFFDLKRLLDNRYMGSLFKVLFAQKRNKKFLLGF